MTHTLHNLLGARSEALTRFCETFGLYVDVRPATRTVEVGPVTARWQATESHPTAEMWPVTTFTYEAIHELMWMHDLGADAAVEYLWTQRHRQVYRGSVGRPRHTLYDHLMGVGQAREAYTATIVIRKDPPEEPAKPAPVKEEPSKGALVPRRKLTLRRTPQG